MKPRIRCCQGLWQIEVVNKRGIFCYSDFFSSLKSAMSMVKDFAALIAWRDSLVDTITEVPTASPRTPDTSPHPE